MTVSRSQPTTYEAIQASNRWAETYGCWIVWPFVPALLVADLIVSWRF